MILQALVKHYETLTAQEKIAMPGWNAKNVSYGLQINDAGELLAAIPLKKEVEKGKKTVFVPRQFNMPETPTRGVGVTAAFLCDNATYLLGMDSKGNLARAQSCFDAERALHLRLLSHLRSPIAKAICNFFNAWDPGNALAHPALGDLQEELAKGAGLIFMYGDCFAHEDGEIKAAWQECYDESDPFAPRMQCLITGKKEPVARLHPIIYNVRNAQAMGTRIVSFNGDAFTSYNREQGYNSPVSEYGAFAYGAALNYLLSDREHTQLVGDTTVVFWSENGDRTYQDAMSDCLNGAQTEETLKSEDIKRVWHAVSQGKTIDWSMLSLSPDEPFYVLGLVPSAARIAVRFFIRNTFGDMLEHLRLHYERMRIVKPAFDSHEVLSLWAMLNETVNQNAKVKKPSPQMAGDTLRSIILGLSYPETLYSAVQLRIRADKKITRGRAAIIKAYLLKNHEKEYKEVITVELNDNTQNLPYVLGRLFALLEQVQEEAATGSLNATIKDHYFNSACATPSVVFPQLIKLKNSHMRVLKRKSMGHAINLEKAFTQLMGLIPPAFPSHLTLAQQGSFEIGYYHQVQKRYTSNKKVEEN